nr:cobalamin biosynthesis protein [Paracoccus ravus]
MIVAGFGFRASANVESLADALHRAGGSRIAAIATAEDKAGGPVFRALAERLAVPLRAIPAEALAAMETPTRSPASLAARRLGSLAEAAALAAAGPNPRLLGARAISGDRLATCALAQGE